MKTVLTLSVPKLTLFNETVLLGLLPSVTGHSVYNPQLTLEFVCMGMNGTVWKKKTQTGCIPR